MYCIRAQFEKSRFLFHNMASSKVILIRRNKLVLIIVTSQSDSIHFTVSALQILDTLGHFRRISFWTVAITVIEGREQRASEQGTRWPSPHSCWCMYGPRRVGSNSSCTGSPGQPRSPQRWSVLISSKLCFLDSSCTIPEHSVSVSVCSVCREHKNAYQLNKCWQSFVAQMWE